MWIWTYMDTYADIWTLMDTYAYTWIHMNTYGGPRARPWIKTSGMVLGPWPIWARRQFWVKAWPLGPHMYPYVSICMHMCIYVSIYKYIYIYTSISI